MLHRPNFSDYVITALGSKVNKKELILKTAIRIFAARGYDAATTLQVARAVGVTEPAILYYFKHKNELFTAILQAAVQCYFEDLDGLEKAPATSAETALETLIRIHFAIVRREPEYMRIVLRTCPASLEDVGSPCVDVYRHVRERLNAVVKRIIEQGVASAEFRVVDVSATADLLIAMLNGLMQQQLAAMDDLTGVEAVAIDFCRRALVGGEGEDEKGAKSGKCGKI